ncbi:MAG: exopolyphosphatase [Flavobacteriales bacterium]|nr:exopolyphosphatase [Flavobacteriales bacterium]
MKIAVIDLGTNTFKLLVASLSAAQKLVVHHEEEVPVGLGKGGIEKGVIAADAFARGLEALIMLGIKAKELGVERVRGFGTSALRNAGNGADFVQQAKAKCGVDISIIPGEEEAGLIVDGVRQAVAFGKKPMLLMDIGGGSIEFILATDKALMWKRSFELGTTRMLERFTLGDLLTMEEHLRMAAHLDAQLEPLWAVMDRHWPRTLVGSAGSFDSLTAIIAAGRGDTRKSGTTTMEFSTHVFDEIKDRLLHMPRADRELVEGLPQHRVDTILPALIATERVLARGIEEIRWSRYALQEGAAWRAFNNLTP